MNVDRAIAVVRELAQARREMLLKELDELDAFLRICDSTEERDVRILTEPLWAKLQDIHGPALAMPTVDRIVEAVAHILRKVGYPLGRGELHRHLIASGVTVPGDHPAKYLGTILYRSGQITTKGRLYWFKDEERPARPLSGETVLNKDI